MILQEILNAMANLENNRFAIYFKDQNEINSFDDEIKKLKIKADITIGQKRIYKKAWRTMIKYCKNHKKGWFFYDSSYSDYCAWGDKEWEEGQTKYQDLADNKNITFVKFSHLSRKYKLQNL